MTSEKCEKKALQALRLMEKCDHPPTAAALKRLVEEYSELATLLRNVEANGGRTERESNPPPASGTTHDVAVS